MTTLFKRIVVLLFISALVTVAGMGCNTAHGFGKDVSNAGEGIQNGTKITTAMLFRGAPLKCTVGLHPIGAARPSV